MTKGFTYSPDNGFRWVVPLLLLLFVVSCSKPDPVTPNPPPVNPPSPATPSGVIEYFRIKDTAIGFARTSVLTWLVSGTNTLTKVSIDGVYYSNSGGISTGILKKDSTFTLSVNNGAQAKVFIHVADSLITLFWNDGKYLMKEKSQVQDTTQASKWRDTTMVGNTGKEMVFFGLDSTSKVTIPPMATSDAGMIIITPGKPGNPSTGVPPTLTTFTWRGINYTLQSIDADNMIVTYKALDANNKLRDWRDFFKFHQ